MQDLISRRDDYYYKYSGLRDLKFSPEARKHKEINEQIKDLKNRYLFFREYIRIGGRNEREKIHTKSR